MSPENDLEGDLEHWLRGDVVEAARQLDAGISTTLTADEVRQHFMGRRGLEEGPRMSEQHPEIPTISAHGPIPGVLVTHDASECTLPFCCIHRPSEHPLALAPLRWRNDLHVMERVCVHGIGHPDPDSLDYVNVVFGEMAAAYACVHFPCDGCCGSVPPGGVFVDG